MRGTNTGDRSHDDWVVDGLLLNESDLFDAAAYRTSVGLALGADAAEHYLLEGWRTGLEPGPNFEGSFLYPYFRSVGFDGPPAITYLRFRAAGWPVYPTRAAAEAVATLIRGSDLFDGEGYAARVGCPAHLDPALHYVIAGEAVGLDPSDRFDSVYYRERYPDIEQAAYNGLAHYLSQGCLEDRRPVSAAANLTVDARRLVPGRETVLLACHEAEAAHTGARLLASNLATRLHRRYNVVVLLLSGGDLARDVETCSAAVVGPLTDADWHPADAQRVVRRLLGVFAIRYAIVDSIDPATFITALASALVPVVTLVNGFPSSMRSTEVMARGLDWSTHVVFSTQLTADAAIREHPPLARRTIHVFPPGPCDYVRRLEVLGEDAVTIMEQRARDLRTLREDPSFDETVFMHPARPWVNRESAIGEFLARWAAVGMSRDPVTSFSFRRPCPGFHPQIYAHERARTLDRHVNPLADYVRRGAPAGPWCHEVVKADVSCEYPHDVALRTAMHGHFFYPDLIDDFLRKLSANRSRCDLLLSTDERAKAAFLRDRTAGYDRGDVVIRVVPNRGRDVGPFLTVYADEIERRYDVVAHLHGKQGLAGDPRRGASWREFLWQHLVGDLYPMMDTILARFAADDTLGLVFPDDPRLPQWNSNLEIASHLASRMGLPLPLPPFFDFPVGAMFWARPRALAPLFGLGLDWNDYPEEPVPLDGTLLHALERLVPFAARQAGYRYVTTHVPGVIW